MQYHAQELFNTSNSSYISLLNKAVIPENNYGGSKPVNYWTDSYTQKNIPKLNNLHKKNVLCDESYVIQTNQKNGEPHHYLNEINTTVNKIAHNQSYLDISKISLNNSNLTTPKAYDFDKLLSQLNNTSTKTIQVANNNNKFFPANNDEKENIEHQFSSSNHVNKSQKFKVNRKNFTGILKDRANIQNYGINSNDNSLTSSSYLKKEVMDSVMKKIPNINRQRHMNDFSNYDVCTHEKFKNNIHSDASRLQNKPIKQHTKMFLDEKVTIGKKQISTNIQQSNKKDRVEQNNSNFINQSFANEKGQPNFSIDLSKIEALYEVSFILSDEKNRECLTSRFKSETNDNGPQKSEKIDVEEIEEVEEEIQKELETGKSKNITDLETTYEHRKPSKNFMKVTLKRSSRSNESSKPSSLVDNRRLSYQVENFNSLRVQSPQENTNILMPSRV